MVNVAFVVYRKWGYDIFKEILQYQKLRKDFSLTTLIVPQDYDFIIEDTIKKKVQVKTVDPKDSDTILKILKENSVSIVCLFSWSWIIKKSIVEKFICLCLHPSPLPRYRGGTPIQNQLINNEKVSAVTIFKMDQGIDSGDIYMQTPISLLGTVNDIFKRMVDVGSIMTKQLIDDAINGELRFTPQRNLDRHPPLKRRTPGQSIVKTNQLSTITYKELYNLVRGLLNPYPNLSIDLSNKLLAIQTIRKVSSLPKNAIIITNGFNGKGVRRGAKLFVKLKDCYAQIVKYKLI